VVGDDRGDQWVRGRGLVTTLMFQAIIFRDYYYSTWV